MNHMNLLAKFEIHSFSRSWDNREYPKNLGSPWIRPRSLFSKIVNGRLFGWTLWISAKFEVRGLTCLWDNSNWSLGWGANPNLGEGDIVGVRDGTLRKRVDDFLQAFHTNCSSTFRRFWDVALIVRAISFQDFQPTGWAKKTAKNHSLW